MLLRLIAETHRMAVGARAPFEKLLNEVEREFHTVGSHRAGLTRLNDARVAFKHRGQEVSESDARVFLANAEAFLIETYEKVLSQDFASLSLADSIGHRRTQNWLAKAEDAFAAGSHADCVAHSAKAMVVYMAHSTRKDVGIELGSVVQYRGGEGEDFESWVNARLPLLQARFDLFTRGVDVAAFDRFMTVTPYTVLTRHGGIDQVPKPDRPPVSRDDARFCLDFVIDSALALRDRRVLRLSRATEEHKRVRLKSSCEVIAHWKTPTDLEIAIGKEQEREVIRVADTGEEFTVASVWRGLRHPDYVAVLQDGDTAYVRRACIEYLASP